MINTAVVRFRYIECLPLVSLESPLNKFEVLKILCVSPGRVPARRIRSTSVTLVTCEREREITYTTQYVDNFVNISAQQKFVEAQ